MTRVFPHAKLLVPYDVPPPLSWWLAILVLLADAAALALVWAVFYVALSLMEG